MVSLQRFFSKHKTGTTFFLLFLCSIILLSISSEKVNFKPQNAGLTVFSLTQSAISGVGNFFSRTVNSINELNKLKQRYDESQQRLSEYRNIERNIVELKLENMNLREQLGFSERIGYNHLSAEIIGKDPGNYFNTITINRGKRDGVKHNMPVIAFQDGFQGLVGKVIHVGLHSSEVLPIFDSSCYVAARLQSSRYEGLVSGDGRGKNVKMEYVKKYARNEIKYGDLVITSGMKSIYPKGIYIGRVREIGGKEYDTSLLLEIEPVIDFARLEYVFIIGKEE